MTRALQTLLMSFNKKIKIVLLGFLCFSSPILMANQLKLTVTLNDDLPKAVEKNIFSYLGALPETDLERSAFIYSAKNNTIKALQALGYYRANTLISIEDRSEKTPWKLNISITLNDPTLIGKVDVKIDGAAKTDPAFIALLNNHNIKQGDALHHGEYEELKSEILSLALQRGYFDGVLTDSRITIKDNYHFADITLHYESGPRYKFADIVFPDTSLTPALLTSIIPFDSNAYYSAQHLHTLQRQLQATQYFGSVFAVPGEKIQNESQHLYSIPINVSLTPAKSHLFNFGIGYATDTQFRLSANWRTPLINKYGHYQETKIEYSSINPTGKFIYSIPLSHPTNDVLQFKIDVENDDYADVTTKFYSAQIGRVVSTTRWNRKLYTRLHKEEWSYDLDSDEPNLLWSAEDSGQYLIPGITLSKTIRSGSATDPSSGFRQTYNIEGAHLKAGSDNSFFRLQGRWNFITTLKEKHRLVSRAELGAIYVDRNAQLAPSLRFYAGGDQSIRGFAYQSIGTTISSSSNKEKSSEIVVGGTRLIVGSIEYQYYLTDKWRMALFSDGGSVTDKGGFEPVYSFGSGVHYLSPVGAIKLDLAYGINDDEKNWRLHINLGAEF